MSWWNIGYVALLFDGTVHLICLAILPTTCMEKFRASVLLDQNLSIPSYLKKRKRWTIESQEIGGGLNSIGTSLERIGSALDSYLMPWEY